MVGQCLGSAEAMDYQSGHGACPSILDLQFWTTVPACMPGRMSYQRWRSHPPPSQSREAIYTLFGSCMSVLGLARESVFVLTPKATNRTAS